MQEKEEKTPLLKEDESENFFAFFSREFVRTFVSEPKPLFLLGGQKDRLFVVCSVRVCVHKYKRVGAEEAERESGRDTDEYFYIIS